MATKTTKPVMFFSKFAEHMIVIHHDTRTLVDGNKLFTTSGRNIQFHRGKYETNEPEVVEFLENHQAYGIDFFSSEDAKAGAVNPEIVAADAEATPEAARPRTRAGQRAGVAAKATTADDVDAEAGVEGGASKADDEDEE